MNETSGQIPESALRPIARDTSDFAKLRRGGCIYVDKTAWFHRMISGSGLDCVFLSRPRRFGKSLMISTLAEIFKGRRELFDGLAIAGTDWKWEEHPVIKFNFAGVSKFSKLSVFSAPSNIVDISMEDPAYATILGYTDEELTANFEPHLREHARRAASSATPSSAWRKLAKPDAMPEKPHHE